MPRPDDVGVGVSVFLVREGHILFGQRKGAHGAGEWAPPGGWIDRTDESIEAACIREVYEETGIVIKETERLCEWKADYSDRGFSAITLFRVVAKQVARLEVVELREPTKCEGWCWFLPEHALTLPLFAGVREAIEVLLHRIERISQ